MKISHLHPEHPTETVIQIEGLRQSVTLMHVSVTNHKNVVIASDGGWSVTNNKINLTLPI